LQGASIQKPDTHIYRKRGREAVLPVQFIPFSPVKCEAISRSTLNVDASAAPRLVCGLLKSPPHLNFPLWRRGPEKLKRLEKSSEAPKARSKYSVR